MTFKTSYSMSHIKSGLHECKRDIRNYLYETYNMKPKFKIIHIIDDTYKLYYYKKNKKCVYKFKIKKFIDKYYFKIKMDI